MNQKITKNFSFYEFRPKGAQRSWLPTNKYQEELIRNLVENLQIVRADLGSGMKITSGVRSPKDYNRLVKLGYHPSATSDHNCGNAVPLKIGTAKYRKYGPTYIFSIGAADCVPSNPKVTTGDMFKLAMQKVKAGLCHFGQVIHELRPDTGSEWVHFGADPRPFFAPHVIHFLGRTQFLRTTNGGKSYSVVVS